MTGEKLDIIMAIEFKCTSSSAISMFIHSNNIEMLGRSRKKLLTNWILLKLTIYIRPYVYDQVWYGFIVILDSTIMSFTKLTTFHGIIFFNTK